MKLRLETINEHGEQRIVALQWARYLLDEYGGDKALDALGIYKDNGWISNSVREDMEDLLTSSLINQQTEYETPPLDWPPLNALDDTEFENHAKSIAFIVKLSDSDINNLDGVDELT